MSPTTTTNPSVCRYCNSRRQLDQCDGVIRFACGTTMQASTNKTITQSTECKLRIELTSARARIAELEGELESHAWEISPAMAQARIDQLFAENEQLKAEQTKRHDEYAKALNRRVDIENTLFSVASGKRDALTPDECRVLANKLGVSPAEQTATPLDRPDKPGWWWWLHPIRNEWLVSLISTPDKEPDGKWLPATPPPVPGGEGVEG